MLVLIKKLLPSVLRWVPMFQGFSDFPRFLHHFALAKLATSSLRVNSEWAKISSRASWWIKGHFTSLTVARHSYVHPMFVRREYRNRWSNNVSLKYFIKPFIFISKYHWAKTTIFWGTLKNEFVKKSETVQVTWFNPGQPPPPPPPPPQDGGCISVYF